jgi:methylase of polypeptide subunit release factors
MEICAMALIEDIQSFDFDTIPIDTQWNSSTESELKIHQIHAYPAKFPAFVTTKAIEYARENNIPLNAMADIFCGCGTTAFEAKRNNINYWGCDINPVATLIARTKSREYQQGRLQQYYETIIKNYKKKLITGQYRNANERLKYWYTSKQYNELAYLKSLILDAVPQGDYQDFFLCAFSNILKPASKWLTKSIKPQIDPHKKIFGVKLLFEQQCRKMFAAQKEILSWGNAENEIITGNFLDEAIEIPKADIIVTSPPYVTSYEYADLHQLSSLWLDYTNDYKELRKGTIGSKHHDYNFEEEKSKLNETGKIIVQELAAKDTGKARSVAKYFLDMQAVAEKAYRILNTDGMIMFVIGNTEYKGVKINNAKHLAHALREAGYQNISVSKRKISKKILTPYRDKKGKFTTNKDGRKVYSEEFILIGRT